MIKGVWIDDPIEKIDEAFCSRLVGCGFSEAAIMTSETAGKHFALRSSPAALERAVATLRTAGLGVILTMWPKPVRTYLDEMAEVRPLIARLNPDAIEVDVEGNWLSGKLGGFRTMEAATDDLVRVLDLFAQRSDGTRRRTEATTYTYHTENGPRALLAPRVDLILPQAYSVNERADRAVPWTDPLGPGGMQRTTFIRAKQARPKAIGFGLAAYEQRFVGHTPQEAMTVAYDETRRLGVERVRYWSSKWIVGSLAGKQPWCERWFRERADDR